jgi:hypothetical protein
LFNNGGIEICREYTPQKRTVCYQDKWRWQDRDGRYYVLQFPYLIFYIDGGLRLAFSPEPIKSLDTIVYRPAIGNVYKRGYYNNTDWRVCGPGGRSIETSVKSFWTTAFTQDGGNRAVSQMTNGRQKWQELSKRKDAEARILDRVRRIKETLTFGEFLNRPKLNCTFDSEYTTGNTLVSTKGRDR